MAYMECLGQGSMDGQNENISQNRRRNCWLTGTTLERTLRQKCAVAGG